MHATPRPGAMPGTLNPKAVKTGKPRGPYGLRQRRVRAKTFGEPRFECELVDEAICPTRPHVLTYEAHKRMVAAAKADGQDTEVLRIHSAYRSVAYQRRIWEYRLEERRRARAESGLPPLPQAELERQQTKWTAKPGTSAHHTGFALDLALYNLGRAGSRRHPAYEWLAHNAVRFGFYPYLPEGWHWEYNPPGLVEQIAALRQALASGAAFAHLLELPKEIPTTKPTN